MQTCSRALWHAPEEYRTASSALPYARSNNIVRALKTVLRVLIAANTCAQLGESMIETAPFCTAVYCRWSGHP